MVWVAWWCFFFFFSFWLLFLCVYVFLPSPSLLCFFWLMLFERYQTREGRSTSMWLSYPRLPLIPFFFTKSARSVHHHTAGSSGSANHINMVVRRDWSSESAELCSAWSKRWETDKGIIYYAKGTFPSLLCPTRQQTPSRCSKYKCKQMKERKKIRKWGKTVCMDSSTASGGKQRLICSLAILQLPLGI